MHLHHGCSRALTNRLSHTLNLLSSEYAQSLNGPFRPLRLRAQRSRVHRGRGTMAELKIDPLLFPRSALFKLRRQPMHCWTHRQANPANTQRHTSADTAHLGPGTHKEMRSANPIHMCLDWVQHYFNNHNRLNMCLGMTWDIVCAS